MKHHLRREMKAALAAMTPEEVSAKSYAACEAFLALPEYRDAQVVMLYLPMPQEVDTAEESAQDQTPEASIRLPV